MIARNNKSIKQMDSENKTFMNNKNWPRFLIVELSLHKLSLFMVQKGFQAIAGTLKKH